MLMKISYIREFMTLAEKSNYNKAAKELYISQTALFNHIKILEDEIGAPLFERTGKAIHISKYGEIFLPYAREILNTYSHFEKEIAEAKLAVGQEITIATQYRIIELIQKFRSSHNNYIVHTLDSNDIEDSLYRRGCELAFARELKDPEGKLHAIPYVDDSIVAVLYRDHPLAERKSVSLKELKNEYFVVPSLGTQHLHSTEDLCKSAGFMPRIVMTVLTGTDAASAVNEELGISLLLKKTMRPHLLTNIVLVDLEPAVRCRISLCWRKDVPLSPCAQEFVRFIQDSRGTGT